MLFSWLVPNPPLNLQADFSWKPSLTPQSGFLCSCFSPSGACCCSVSQLCLILCGPVEYSMPSFPVLYHLPEFAQTHVYWVSDAIQPRHPLSPTSPPALNLSQHQGLFRWVGFLYQVAKVFNIRFRISPSNEYVGLISFRTAWFDLLAVQGILKSLLQHYSLKASWDQIVFMMERK